MEGIVNLCICTLATSPCINKDDESCGKLLISYLVPEKGLESGNSPETAKLRLKKSCERKA